MATEGDLSLVKKALEPLIGLEKTESAALHTPSTSKWNISENYQLKQDIFAVTNAGKRKSGTDLSSIPKKCCKMNSATSASSKSIRGASKLKTHLIAANAQAHRKEMEKLFEEEKNTFKNQHIRHEQAVAYVQERLFVMRRREQQLKDEFAKAKKTFREHTLKWDKEKADLQKQVAELKGKLLKMNAMTDGQISEIKKDVDELLVVLEGAHSDVVILKKELETQTNRASLCITIQTMLEEKTVELQQVTSKVKQMSYWRDSSNYWQQREKTAQKKVTELEKEVAILRDKASNKLDFEVQVHLLRSRLKAIEPALVHLVETKAELENWKVLASSQGVETPEELVKALMKDGKQRVAAAECKLTEIIKVATELKNECEKAITEQKNLLSLLRAQDAHIRDLQEKLELLTRERNSYRDQVTCYETEFSVNSCTKTEADSTVVIQERN